MKASSLFAITVALLLALGVLVGAKYTGLFDAPAPATVIEKKKAAKPPLVVVANRNLVRGTAAMPGDAKVRPLTEMEIDFYEKNKTKLLPPSVRAVEYRVLARSVAAGQPLLEEYFEPHGIPEPLSMRLEPGMRTVHLSVMKDQAAGGLLRVGERVDVLLTAEIKTNPCKDCQPVAPFVATAVIARNLKIAIKRDSFLTMMAPIPQDKPLSFILEANPYRAALIDYAKSKGTITLTPSTSATQALARNTSTADFDSREYRDEDKRVQEFLNNEVIVSDADLERIFNLKPRPPVPQVVSAPPVRVEMMVGLNHRKTMVLDDGAVRYEGPKSLRPTSGKNSAKADLSAMESESAFSFSPPPPRPTTPPNVRRPSGK